MAATMRAVLALGCLLLVATAASARELQGTKKLFAKTLYASIVKAKLTTFQKVVDAAGMKGYLSNPNLYATLFAPDDEAWRQLLTGDMKISVKQLLEPSNKHLLQELVKSCIVPNVRLYTPMWPKFPRKVFVKTLHPTNKIGLEMDDGGPRPGDIFDVDGTDDDGELIARKSWTRNLKVGRALLHILDDVVTWKGWKAAILKNVRN